MIAKKLYYNSTMEHKDRILAEIYVDKGLIKVMQARILEEIEEVAIYQHKELDSPDDIDDILNYIRDMIDTYKNLSEALEDIDAKEALSKIPPDDDNE